MAEFDLAVIGGGFCGAMAVANTVRSARGPVSILWVDAQGSFARGVAYGTREDVHLLNVQADRMGAFADDIGGFYAWLKAHGFSYAPTDYVPRRIYGDYLEYIVSKTERLADEKNITLTKQVVDISDITAQDTLHLSNGAQAKRVVLACGNLFAAASADAPKGYVENPWAAWDIPAGAKRVVILGTGLTMADMALSLRARGFASEIVALSRRGHLSQPHAVGVVAQPGAIAEHTPRTARGYVRAVRAAVGNEWRSVIDGLRGVTPALWRQLPEAEKKRFMRHLFSWWNSHRHRMAPQIARALTEDKGLRIVAGNIVEVADNAVTYRPRGKSDTETLRAELILNCIGPHYDIRKSKHPLLKNLLAKGLIALGPINMGAVSQDTRLTIIGALKTGEDLESTAVPELRVQASQA